jgi:uncharacterized protein YjiS (DUF1127 family)
MGLLTTVTAFVRQYHYFHGALHALERASERQLADMGIERGDLARLAWKEGGRRASVETHRANRPFRKFEAGSLELSFAGQR